VQAFADAADKERQASMAVILEERYGFMARIVKQFSYGKKPILRRNSRDIPDHASFSVSIEKRVD